MATVTDRRKSNAGRKPVGDKKRIPITIYRPADKVKALGGKEVVREALGDYFDSKIAIVNMNEPAMSTVAPEGYFTS